MVTFGFKKENPMNASTPSIQRYGQPNKIAFKVPLCWLNILGLPHGFELLEGNIHDQDELPYGQWAMSKNAIHLGS